MKVRAQRTHYMGFSNRNQETNSRNATTDIFQKSFNKSRSQYYHTATKVQPFQKNHHQKTTLSKNSYTSQINFNQLYKQSQKGHHFQFENKKLNKKNKNLAALYQQKIQSVPLPLNLNSKLNENIKAIRTQFQDKDINLHKLNQLKSTFLRNNQKRKNLKAYFDKYANQKGLIQKQGFQRLIKDYGYEISQQEINLVWKLNLVHENSQHHSQNIQHINLPQFINLMTKQNVYFQTLKVNNLNPSRQVESGYTFSPADFEIFRNKFPKLKEAFGVYKGDPINLNKFQKVMKKLDINDLVIKQSKRQEVFRQFSNQKGQLNVQKLLSVIARQQHQRIHKSGNQLKVTNHDSFQQNIKANQQFTFQKQTEKDPLLQLLYPLNLKKASFNDFEKHLYSARKICNKLKQIKQKENRDIIGEIYSQKQNIKKQDLYKRVQKALQKQGYNFSKNQYKSFVAYLDFDSSNQIEKDNLEKFVLKQTDKQRVDRLDRRKRNQPLTRNDKLNQQNQSQNSEVQFLDRFRSKSSINWNNVRKSNIAQQNTAQFHIPTKFSAWPQRLYKADFSMIQSKSAFGMGLSEQKRFQKDEKHFLGQEQKQNKIRMYENRIRKTAQWQQINQQKLLNQCGFQEKKQLAKQYNLRLIKEQYEQRCHNNTVLQ